MRVVVQRAKYAKVSIDGELYNEINEGYCVFVGITHEDTKEIVEKVAKKLVGLRVFKDEEDKMNKSISDIGGKILSISQFTLYADCKKGRRPSFVGAAKPEQAKALYEYFNRVVEEEGIEVKTGIFGADMKIELYNDGPVTILLDSDEL